MNSFTSGFFRTLARRRTMAHLRELDAHLLADIGLTPEDVRRVEARNSILGVLVLPNR